MLSTGKTVAVYLGVALVFAFAILSGFHHPSWQQKWGISKFTFAGHSIKCWVCRSDGDPKCADPFDNRQPTLIFHHDENDGDDDVQVVPNHRLPARSRESSFARP